MNDLFLIRGEVHCPCCKNYHYYGKAALESMKKFAEKGLKKFEEDTCDHLGGVESKVDGNWKCHKCGFSTDYCECNEKLRITCEKHKMEEYHDPEACDCSGRMENQVCAANDHWGYNKKEIDQRMKAILDYLVHIADDGYEVDRAREIRNEFL